MTLKKGNDFISEMYFHHKIQNISVIFIQKFNYIASHSKFCKLSEHFYCLDFSNFSLYSWKYLDWD